MKYIVKTNKVPIPDGGKLNSKPILLNKYSHCRC